MDNTRLEVARAIRKTRIEKNMSQMDLAKKSGISRAGISMIEGARQSITIQTFCVLCKALEKRPGAYLDEILTTINNSNNKITIDDVKGDEELFLSISEILNN